MCPAHFYYCAMSTANVLWGCCDGELNDENYLTCVTCKKAFHHACLTNYDNALISSETWNCPLCSVKTRVTRNDSTPVRFNANVTVRGNKRQALHSPPNTTGNTFTADEVRVIVNDLLDEKLDSMLAKINHTISSLISEELRGVKDELKSVKDSMNAERIQFKNLVTEHEVVKETLEQLKLQNTHMQHTITELGTRLQYIEKDLNKAQTSPCSAEQQVPTDVSLQLDAVPASTCVVAALDDTPKIISQTMAPVNSNPVNSLSWSEVVRKPSRRAVSIHGAAGPNVTSLKAVEVRKHLHLWNMESTADEIQKYLYTLCNTDTCTVQELTPKGNYKSFKIGVPLACFEKCYSADVWPMNARIKPWIYYRKSTATNKDKNQVSTLPRESNNSQQPFRDEGTGRNQEVQKP